MCYQFSCKTSSKKKTSASITAKFRTFQATYDTYVFFAAGMLPAYLVGPDRIPLSSAKGYCKDLEPNLAQRYRLHEYTIRTSCSS